jgi:hypothetical protein
MNRPYDRKRMKRFCNNETIKSILHVPHHVTFTTSDPVIVHFLKVGSLLPKSNIGGYNAIHRSSFSSTALRVESNVVSGVIPQLS